MELLEILKESAPTLACLALGLFIGYGWGAEDARQRAWKASLAAQELKDEVARKVGR